MRVKGVNNISKKFLLDKSARLEKEKEFEDDDLKVKKTRRKKISNIEKRKLDL